MTGTQRSKDMAASPLVVVLDDEPAVRITLGSLLRSVGFRVEGFGSAQDFLASNVVQTANCVVLDIRLPRVSGFDFQKQLVDTGIHVPIIFMTGYGDIPMSVRAMKAGAIDFLAKPFRDQDMLEAVAAAVERDMQRRDSDGIKQDQQTRYNSLSDRERQVMALATAGLLNKQIAFELGIQEITVKIHRGRMTRKMGATSFAELVRTAEALGIRGKERLR
jgi:FixJ family two-component response regulator